MQRAALVVLGGWFVFCVLWTLFILGWSQGEVPLANAALSGLIVTAVAATLSFFVWKLTGRISWPESPSASFVALQLMGAALFSIAWTVITPVVGTLIEGGSVADLEWDSGLYSWRLLMGVWLYFIVVGLSYATRINRRLRTQREIAARAEAHAARANLEAMRSQLHPHFLFNALHSVSALIETDPDKASGAMEMLGDLLRYAIRERDLDTVSLNEEWKFVTDYVALQKIRFGDTIEISMEKGPLAGDQRVPPFVLQPLVENAFMHGVRGTSGQERIDIKAVAQNGELTLIVEDEGTGDGRIESGGTGLQNLSLRLKSLYGTAATLSVSARPGGGTTATITLPATS